MINLQVVIGIEVHVALNTKTKMFSNAINSHYKKPNTSIDIMDLAFPGVMPSVNKEAIIKGLTLANVLKMQQADKIEFDRKNYFYIDLPKGFQITQQYNPIGENGIIRIQTEKFSKDILIERIHLEEDTAKKINENNKIYLDYNRCGTPLIEIVTKPCINSAVEAVEYLKSLRRILLFNNISDAKMEDGSMRADINISLNPVGASKLGNKVEIKNVNSISNVAKAIDFEIKRQTSLILTNQIVEQQTRRFNDKNNSTEFMRTKTDAIDYRYITEPNILSFKIPKEILDNKKIYNVIDPNDLYKKYINDLTFNQITSLLDNFELYKLFDKVNIELNDPKTTYNWIIIELVGAMNKSDIRITDINNLILSNITNMIKKINTSEINAKQAKTLLVEILNTKKDVNDLIKELGFIQITDKNIIGSILDKYIEKNLSLLDEYENRSERVIKFFVGMVMKETKAQANPNITLELLKEKIKNKLK